MAKFDDVFLDETKRGRKIQTSEYLSVGKYPIVDQSQAQIAGYTNLEEGLFRDVPAIVFGDHTRTIKYIDSPFFLGADGVKLLKSKVNGTDYKYLFYCLQNAKIPNTGYNRHFKWLKDVDIPLPPLEEQRRIAAVLDKVSDLIAKRRAQLDKLDELVKARFVEMFGNPVSNENNWPTVTLGDIAEIRIGPFGSLIHKEDYIAGGHALVNPSHIIDGQICVDENFTISDEKYYELSAYQLEIDDIVLGRRGEMGRCSIVKQEGLLCGTGSIIIRPNAQMKPYFLQSIISNPAYKKTIEDKAVGVTMMNLNVPIVSALTVPLLPVHLQEQFIDVMERVDKSKLTIKQSLDKLEILKKALMQEYFG